MGGGGGGESGIFFQEPCVTIYTLPYSFGCAYSNTLVGTSRLIPTKTLFHTMPWSRVGGHLYNTSYYKQSRP